MSTALAIPLVVALFIGAVVGLVGLIRNAAPAGDGTPTPRLVASTTRPRSALARWDSGELSLEEFLAVARRRSYTPDALRSRPQQHRLTDDVGTRAMRSVRPLQVVPATGVTQ